MLVTTESGTLVDNGASRQRTGAQLQISERTRAEARMRCLKQIAAVGRIAFAKSFCVRTLFCAAILWSSCLMAQISPGPLSKFHQDLDGPTGCTKCHAVSAGAPTFRCIDCHAEIAVRLQQKRGFHAAVMNSTERYQACVKCHSEHNGENFSLVRWMPAQASFDHTKAGFLLDGKHAGLACSRCHNADKITPEERGTIKVKDLNRSFLGLSQTCTSCHEDKHNGKVGTNCLQCHNTTNWKQARSFDHSKAKFQLTGAHVHVACEKCHRPIEGATLQLTGLRFGQCSSCHSDVHRGEFKQQCESCHNTIAWKQTSFVTKFDHSKTSYPLLGKHLELQCGSCHRAGDFKSPIAHQQCADCHKPDPHNGQFAKRRDGGKCESCHTVDGFKQTTFVAANHEQTEFPLRGKHATVECAKCHIAAGRATVFKVKFASCTNCHQDAHHSQFAKGPYFNHCEQCHSENDFHVTSFTLARHQKTSFVLTGAHVATDCLDCHKPLDGVSASQRPYHFDKLSCTTCHADPHRNEFRVQMAALTSGRPAGCEACHTTKTFKDVSKFEHSSTEFQLTGAHRAVQCDGCHRPPNMELNLKNVNFKAAPKVCEDCHEDPHGKQFAKAGATHCSDCHNTTKWRPSLFDHETTQFSLKGAHQDVKCKSCHVGVQMVEGHDVLFYKPTPTKCASCHSSDNVKVGLMIPLAIGSGKRT